MRQFSVFSKVGALVILAANPGFATLVTYLGNAYSPGASPQRATWENQLASLTDHPIDLASDCASPCAYSYNSGPASLTNVSGMTIGGVTFVGSNTGVGGNGLYVRPIQGTSRNSPYTPLAGNGGFPQWKVGLATVQGVLGTPTLTLTLPSGTRAIGFDFGNINSESNITITTATLSNVTSSLVPANRYDTGTGNPNYLTTGPGFYGVTSSDEDILTVTLSGNSTTGSKQWILNIANIRFGTVAAEAAVPEPSPQLMLGAALISISLLLRHRSKSQRGGNA